MNKLADALYTVALTLWVGSLWTVGGLVKRAKKRPAQASAKKKALPA